MSLLTSRPCLSYEVPCCGRGSERGQVRELAASGHVLSACGFKYGSAAAQPLNECPRHLPRHPALASKLSARPRPTTRRTNASILRLRQQVLTVTGELAGQRHRPIRAIRQQPPPASPTSSASVSSSRTSTRQLDFLRCSASTAASPGVSSGEWIDRIINLEKRDRRGRDGSRPDGSDMFEVERFHSPPADAEELAPAANRPGPPARRLQGRRRAWRRRPCPRGSWETVGEIVDFENTFLLCYVRRTPGPAPKLQAVLVPATRSLHVAKQRPDRTQTAPNTSAPAIDCR